MGTPSDFNQWPLGNVLDIQTGHQITLRANRSSDVQQFNAAVSYIFSSTNVGFVLDPIANGEIYLRSIETNGEDPSYPGLLNSTAIYSPNGSHSSDSLMDQYSRFDTTGGLYIHEAGGSSLISPKTVSINFAEQAQFLAVDGTAITNLPLSRKLLHELVHARNNEERLDNKYSPELYTTPPPSIDISAYEEQITIFMENYLSQSTDPKSIERVGHLAFGGSATGKSKSSVSYLRGSAITSYEFDQANNVGDFSPVFKFSGGSKITKVYYQGRTTGSSGNDYAGADRVEIRYEGQSSLFSATATISEVKAKAIVNESAINNANPIEDIKSHIGEINRIAPGKINYAPQALVVLSGERVVERGLDFEGPRPDSNGEIKVEAHSSTLFGIDALSEDLDSLVIGSAGWQGTSGSSATSTGDLAGVKDVLIGKAGDDILATYSPNDGNKLFGGEGNDLLLGYDRADTLQGDGGDDVLSGFAGNDSLSGGTQRDLLFGGAGNDTLDGGTGDDTLWGGSGADSLVGGSGADHFITDGDDVIGRGEVEDELYWKADIESRRFTGGKRTVSVDDNQSRSEQIQIMRNSTADFVGVMGERYRITGNSAGYSLSITMEGKEFTIPEWHEGEYGIKLLTSKKRTPIFKEWLTGFEGLDSVGWTGSLGQLAVNTAGLVYQYVVDPNWTDYNDSEFTLAKLDQLAGLPYIPPSSNNLEGTDEGEEIHGVRQDDRIFGKGGSDILTAFAGDDFVSGGDGTDLIDAGIGADRVDGGNGDDTIIAGKGNDVVITGAGADTVIVKRGDGLETIYADAQDIIKFDDTIGSSEVSFRSGASVGANPDYGTVKAQDISLGLGSDRITLNGGAFGSIQFGDGTVKTSGALAKAAVAGSITAGDDNVIGSASADRITGGAGNDYLNGMGGNDFYVFARGDGHDRVEDHDLLNLVGDSPSDILQFATGIAPNDIVVSTSTIQGGERDGDRLVRLAISGTNDWVEFPITDVEEVRFADGTVWKTFDLGSRIYQSLISSGNDVITIFQDFTYGSFRPGAGNDLIRVNTPSSIGGFSGANIQFGVSSGLDRIELLNENQTYGSAAVNIDSGIGIGDLRLERIAGGYAATIDGTSDRVEMASIAGGWSLMSLSGDGFSFGLTTREGIDNIGRIADLDTNAVQHLNGTSAANVISGGASGDRISGKAGDDQISGFDGADLLFGGTGNDTITGGNGRDMLFGESGNDSLDGGADSDEIYAGAGLDTLLGGAGDDLLHGNGTSTITGGTGADTISLAVGDVLQFNTGDGLDVIQLGATPTTFDGSPTVKRSEIVLGTGITAASTTLTLKGWSVVISPNGSMTDQIRLDRVFQSGALPSIRFADNTVWTEHDIYARLFNPNNGNDTPTGVASVEPDWFNNTIGYTYGGGGNDLLNPPFASERNFVFAPGDGNDTINTGDGELFLSGFDADSLRIQRSGANLQDFTLSFVGSSDTVKILNQQIESGAPAVSSVTMNGTSISYFQLNELAIAQSTSGGNDTIYGFDGPGGSWGPGYGSPPGNDKISGDLGNDLMIGGKGDDTYAVTTGDGQDTIRDIGLFNAAADAGYDVLKIGADSATATFARSTSDANDLVVKYGGGSDQVTIDEFFAKGQIEEIQFADGIVYTVPEIQQLTIAGSATAGADSIVGSINPDEIVGGTGNDTLNGLAGADRYIFNLGDGSDTIADSGTGESNTLVLGAGIDFASLQLSKVGNDLKIKFNATETLTVSGQFAAVANPPLGQIVFAGGSRKSAAEVVQTLLAQSATSGNDTITGFASNDGISGASGNDLLSGSLGNDTLTGGMGNDTLDGGVGTDHYVIASGDGVDQIASTGDPTASDIVDFSSINSRDVQFVRPTPTSPDLIVNVRGTSQSVTVSNYFGGTAVASFSFADGVTFAVSDVSAALANSSPTVTGQAWRVEVSEGGISRFAIPDGLFADDASTIELIYSAKLANGSPLPSWLAFNGRVFEANGNDANVGTWSIKITATDRFGASVERTVAIDLANSAEAPEATSGLSTQTAPVGTAFSYTLPAGLFTDQDMLYATTPAPIAGSYATDHGGTLVVQSNGSYTYTPAGSYSGADAAYVPLNVGAAANLERLFALTSTGSPASGTLPVDLAPEKDVVTLTARLSNGDALPSWLTFNGNAFSGTPAAGDAGPLAVEIVATDASGLATVIPLSIKVGTANQAPTSTTLGTVHATEDAAFYFAVPAGTFADADARDRLILSATKADGSPLPSWLTFDGAAFSGVPENGAVGSLSLKVTATDIFGTTVNSALTLVVDNVNDAPTMSTALEDQLTTQGQAFSYAIPSGAFVDPDTGDTLTITATQSTGDALPSWLSFAGGILSGTPGASDPGIYQIRLTATDAAGVSTYQDVLVGVIDSNDAPTVAQSVGTVTAPIGTTTNFLIPSGLFADSDDAGYRVAVTLEDGSPLPSWIMLDEDGETIHIAPGAAQLQGKDAAAAHLNLKITAIDTRGASVSTLLPVQIDAPSIDFTVNGSGSNTIFASEANERINSGSGNNTIFSNGGSDRIVFGPGTGQDVLNRSNATSSNLGIGDVVEVMSGITLADVTITRGNRFGSPGPTGPDLLIKMNATSDQLWVMGQFTGDTDGVVTDEPTIREIRFADGTIISAAQLLAPSLVFTSDNDLIGGGANGDMLNGGAGDDTLCGSDGDDTLDGGSGNDFLNGDSDTSLVNGNDTFLFYRGAGKDRILADDSDPSRAQNTLRFGPSIAPSDLVVTHVPGPAEYNYTDAASMLIQISGTQDSVQIYNQFYATDIDDKELVQYGIDRFEFADGTVMNRAQFEALIALAPTTAGNDKISGGAAPDRLQGGQGNDTLVGEGGADTYVYNAGDGNDLIRETEEMGAEGPLGVYGPRAGNIVSTDSLSFGPGIAPEDIVFTKPDADGQNLVISFKNQPGSVTIEGQFRNILHQENFSGSVVSYYGVENAAIDEIRFADGTKWSLADIYAYSTRGTSGNDTIDGFFRPSETLDGGPGNDLLAGRNGNDTYVFARGYGNDTIKDFGFFWSEIYAPVPYVAADRIKFVGVASNEVTTKIGPNGAFVFTIINTGETLSISGESEFNNFTAIEFSDTTWNQAQFQARWTVASATSGNDAIYGFIGNDTINGGDGNDTLQGGQNISSGFDSLSGGNGSDTLILESSDNDRANGDDGDDTFRIAMTLPYTASGIPDFDRGRIDYPNFIAYGTERGVIDGGLGNDTLILGGKFADYWRGSNYVSNNGDGSYTFKGGLTVRNVETVQFADGTLPFASIAAATAPYRPNPVEGTSGNDSMNGTAGNDALYGLDGNDTLNGLDGNDFLIGGAGTDTYNGGNGTDIVEYSYDTVGWAINLSTGQATQSTTTETLTSIEGAYGSKGFDTITGSANADVLGGGAGDDTINAGDGNDFIDYEGNSAGFDAIDGGNGSDTVRAVSNDTFIGLSSLTGVETITANGFTNVNILGSSAANTLNFATTALSGIGTIDGGSGNDTITGTDNGDKIVGGAGDDSLNGGLGDDVFTMFNTSDGFDAVVGGGGNDVILAGDNNARIGLTAINGVETISWNGLSGAYIQGSTAANTLDFSNVALVQIARIDGGSGNDVITGSAAADTILGSGGDDSLYGGLGNDQFRYSGSSNGFDSIDGGAGTNDMLATANSTVIGLSALSNIQSISGGVFTNVSIAGSTNADTLNFSAVTLSGIVKIDAGSGNDSVTGSTANDTILGSGGDDSLSGADGNDTFQYTGASNGFDAVDGGNGTDTISALANSTVIGLTSVTGIETISSGGFTGVTISGSGNADSLNFSGITLTGIASINGGAGNDSISGSAIADVILGGTENDTLSGGDGYDTLNGGAGTNILDGGNGTDVAQYSGTAGSYSVVDNGNGTYGLVGAGISDTLSNIENLNFSDGTFSVASRVGLGLTLTGTASAETLTGGGNADTITGLGGDDTLVGNGGDDVFRVTGTGDGFDNVDGGLGADTITATVANATIGLTSLSGVEVITAGGFSGVSIVGSSTANTLNFGSTTLTSITKIDGGAGNDTITGSGAADTILGSGGDDSIAAGGGNDVIQYTGSSNGFDAIDGGSGTDTISALANSTVIGLSSLTGVETISGGAFTGVNIAGSGNADSLDFTSTTLTAITKIDGGSGNDTILGSTGNDTILGSGGDDSLNGGGGNDVLQYTGSSNGFDIVDGGLGTDTISALANSTVIGLTSITGVETISGGSFTGVNIAGSSSADTLNFGSTTLTAITKIDGGAGNDTITGSGAADTILGSGGDDNIAAGGGNDAIQYTGTANGFDAIDGGAGTDTLSALANSTVIGLSSLTGVETISGGSFTGVYVQGSGNADTLNFSAVTLTAITRVEGGAGNDVITGNTAANTLWGGLDADTIDGGSGNDTIVGDDGDDIIIGGAGNDNLNGANGTDTVDYSYATANLTVSLAVTTAQTVSTGDADTLSNFENLTGGTGADTLTGSTGNNSIKGGSGNDRMTGGVGNDSIDGGIGTIDVAVFAGLQASYTLTTVSGTTTVVDNQPTTDGNDGTDTLIATEKAEFKGGVQVNLATPIALDLDGDGVELIDKKKSKASFDWDGDGDRDKTGWVGKDDGLLVFDRNGDGSINAVNELSFVDDKPGAKSDLDGLSAFDSNHDGIFSAEDDAFASFGVWRDRNGDGKSQTNELMTLADAGIGSINLAGTAVNRNWGWNDNLVINTGSFTRTDGSEHAFGDIALNYSETKGGRSRYAPSVAASRFAEAIASFRSKGGDEVTLGKHDMELTKVPVFAGDHYRNI